MKFFVVAFFFFLPMACRQETDATDTGAALPAAVDSAAGLPDEVALTPEQIRTAGIQTGRINYRVLSQTLSLNGRVVAAPQNRITVSPLQGGFIRQISLLPGQSVRKGQVLARIENLDLLQLQQDYAESRARLTYLEAEYARQQELSRENVGALKVFQQTTAELNGTRARQGALAQRLRRVGLAPENALRGQFVSTYTLTSPVNGIITEVPANLGQFVQPTDVVAQLIGTDGLYAELTVFEKDLSRLQEGQLVRIQLSGDRGPGRRARIYLINRQVDSDRSARALARFEGGPGNRPLRPNAFLQATVELGSNPVPALPEGAIVTSEGKEYIFVQQPGPPALVTYKALPVRRGVTQSGFSEVVLPAGFLPATAAVVVQGAYALLSQLRGAGEEE